MILELSPAQIATISAALRPGHMLLCRIMREQFCGTNPDSSGTLQIEFAPVPLTALTAIREAIQKAKS